MVNKYTSSRSQATDIGILFVHGIGEQRQFQALQGLANSFMKALANQQTRKRKINLQINKLSSGPLGAEQQTWDDRSQAPIIIYIKDALGQDIRIHLREVWWADIDPPNNLGKVLRFWQWGLSLWSTRRFLKGPIPSDYEDELILLQPNLVPPFLSFFNGFLNIFGIPAFRVATSPENKNKRGEIFLLARPFYFVIGIIFFLVQPILSFFNVFFNIFGIPFVSVTAITQFASKIRLYQLYQLYQKKSDKYKGTLQDLDNPPRFTVRRRMINAIIPMATSGYDRWYIMAHSLGAVVAFNSLSELELSLANYLDKKMWNRACLFGLNRPDTLQASPVSVRGNMRPSRPFWLGENDRIYRHKLFKNLQGLVTYGAPLDIFSDLWPAMMLGNKKKGAFNSSFKWFNIHDPSDPIATEAEPLFQYLDDYHGIKPIDIAYKADGLHLLSHISYLNVDPESPKSNDALIDRILDWVMYEKLPNTSRQHTASKKWLEKEKEKDKKKKKEKKPFRIRVHELLSYLLWFIGSYLAALILTGILGLLNMVVNFNLFNIFPQSLNRCSNSWIIGESLCNILLFYPFCWIILALIAVLFMGILQSISQIFAFDLKERILSFLEDQANQLFTVKQIKDKFGEPTKVQKTLDELIKENKIRKNINNEYFFPSYSFILSDVFKNKLTVKDVDTRLKLIDEIIEKLSFNPDAEGEDRFRRSFIDFEGQEYPFWSLEISSDLIVSYSIVDSSIPLQDSIISLTDLI